MWIVIALVVLIVIFALAARSFPDRRHVLARGVFSRKSVGEVELTLPPSLWDEPWHLTAGRQPETLIHFADGRTFRAYAEIDVPFPKGTPIVLLMDAFCRIVVEVDEEATQT